MEKLIAWGLTTLIGAFVGSYLAGYLKRKGENLATKEDFNVLSQQTATLTQITKDIDAAVSHKLWDSQRQWEMKRDAVFTVVEALSRADDCMVEVASAYHLAKKDGVEKWMPKMAEVNQAWFDQMNILDEKRAVAQLVCSHDLANTIMETVVLMRNTNKKIRNFEFDDYAGVGKPMQQKIHIVIQLARKELGISDPD